MNKILKPVHPGTILAYEFLEPLGISEYRLAIAIAVPPAELTRSPTA